MNIPVHPWIQPNKVDVMPTLAGAVTWALLAHAAAASSDGSADAVTSAVDTTGAKLIVISAGRSTGGGAFTISDSAGNTWTALTARTGGSAQVRLYYVINPTTSASHTFTVHATNGGSASETVTVWKPSSGTVSFDVESGAAGGATTAQPGSITPAVANELLVTGLVHSTGGTDSIDSSFIISDQTAGTGNNTGNASGYLTASAAKNPTWTYTSDSNAACAMAAFKSI